MNTQVMKQSAKLLLVIAALGLCSACTQLQPAQQAWDGAGAYAPVKLSTTPNPLGPSATIF